jgi:hypothetical protein
MKYTWLPKLRTGILDEFYIHLLENYNGVQANVVDSRRGHQGLLEFVCLSR